MEKHQLLQLLNKYQSGTCTEQELARLDNWYQQLKADEADMPETGKGVTMLKEYMLQEFRQSLQDQQIKPTRQPVLRRRIVYAAAAATLLILLLVAGWLYMSRLPVPANGTAATEEKSPAGDIAPGTDKASLTLANGTIIELDTAASGLLAVQGTASVRQSETGLLQYDAAGDNAEPLYNTIATPKGGQYQVLLPDGTHAWLNAASSIRFPVAFSGKSRPVSITGEVYFEVARQPEHPFVVSFNNNTVEVLGTHFNINSYVDEVDTKVTLLEGSIAVKRNSQKGVQQNRLILKPGQQAWIHNSSGKDIQIIAQADVEQAMAWKNGLFQFNDAGISEIMRQAERWYNIEVDINPNYKEDKFRGKIARNVVLSEFLKILSLNNVPVKLDGRKVSIGY